MYLLILDILYKGAEAFQCLVSVWTGELMGIKGKRRTKSRSDMYKGERDRVEWEEMQRWGGVWHPESW